MTEETNPIEEQKKREEIIQKIRAEYPKAAFPEPLLEPIYYGRLSKNLIKNRKLVLDKITGSQFDIVSDSYKLIHHEEVLDLFIKSVPEGLGKPEIGMQFFRNGGRAAFTATFPEVVKEVNHSKTNLRFTLKNSYDRSSYLSFSYGVLELICANGLVGYVNKKQSAKHLARSIDKYSLSQQFQDALTHMNTNFDMWSMWGKTYLEEPVVREVVSMLPFSENEREKVMVLPLLNHKGESIVSMGRKATLWTVNSAATQYANLVSDERKMDIEIKLPVILKTFADRLK